MNIELTLMMTEEGLEVVPDKHEQLYLIMTGNLTIQSQCKRNLIYMLPNHIYCCMSLLIICI